MCLAQESTHVCSCSVMDKYSRRQFVCYSCSLSLQELTIGQSIMTQAFRPTVITPALPQSTRSAARAGFWKNKQPHIKAISSSCSTGTYAIAQQQQFIKADCIGLYFVVGCHDDDSSSHEASRDGWGTHTFNCDEGRCSFAMCGRSPFRLSILTAREGGKLLRGGGPLQSCAGRGGPYSRAICRPTVGLMCSLRSLLCIISRLSA